MTEPQSLRGALDHPFVQDLTELNGLKEGYVSPHHEPLWFLRNRGTASDADVRRIESYLAEDNIDRMAELGLHHPARVFFFKGLGLERERPSIEKTIAYARRLHERGLLVSVYVGGTFFPEYFLKEVPEAISWFRKDQHGQMVTYGGFQVQRWFPCLNNPEYMAYLERVLDIAVGEVQADEIFFDNQILRYEPRSCRCAHCVEHLRKMVRERYSLDQCEERYGIAEHPDLVPPVWSQAAQPWRLDKIIVPHVQDWIDHRIATVVEFYRHVNEYIKAQSPSTAVGMNVKGIHGHNRAFDHGICHGALSDILDFSCIDGYKPGGADGAISSEMRFWKSSQNTHISIVDRNHSELEAAEGQVYGYRKKIEGHGWLGGMGNCAVFTPMTQFLHARQELFRDGERLQDIAVLRSEPSTNYNCAKVHEQLMAFEETLAVEKIPWGIIFDKQISVIDKYRVIALPEIQALSDAWLARLDVFVNAGGAIIASGEAGAYTEWYRPRSSDHGLAAWLGHAPGGDYEVARVGKGRVVYVPEWDVQTKWDFSDWFAIWRNNVLPIKSREIFRRAIDDAAGDRPLTFRVTGPDPVFVEAIESKDGTDLHFINYRLDDCGEKLAVEVAVPEGTTASVTLIDPHDEGHRSWEVASECKGSVATFEMSVPRVYGLARVRFR